MGEPTRRAQAQAARTSFRLNFGVGGEIETELVDTQLDYLRPELQDLVENIEILGRRPGSTILPEDNHNFTLGFLSLDVPPVNIKIDETKFNSHIPALRNNADGLVKSGHAAIKVSVDMVFPNPESIDDKLRLLVAQFKMMPIVPVHNEYIASALFKENPKPELDSSTIDSNLEQARKLREECSRLLSRWYAAIQEIDQESRRPQYERPAKNFTLIDRFLSEFGSEVILGNENNQTDLVLDRFLGGRADQSVDYWKNLADSAISRIYTRLDVFADASELGAEESEFTFLQAERAAWTAFKSRYADLRQIRANLINLSQRTSITRTNTVLVSQHRLTVAPIPDSPEALGATLEMWVFNPLAYSPIPMFNTDDGSVSTSLANSKFLLANLNTRFLNRQSGSPWSDGLGLYHDLDNNTLSFIYPTPDIQEQTSIKDNPISYDVGTGSRVSTVNPDIPSGLGASFVLNRKVYSSVYRKLSITPSERLVTVEKVTVGMSHKLASQPVQGAMLAAHQHLGRRSSMIEICLLVNGQGDVKKHDALLREIQSMHHLVEEAAILGGSGFRRRAFVLLEEKMLNILGIRAAYIDDVTVNTVGPAASEVKIRLIEYSRMAEDAQALTTVAQDYRRDVLLDALQIARSEIQNTKNRVREAFIDPDPLAGNHINAVYRIFEEEPYKSLYRLMFGDIRSVNTWFNDNSSFISYQLMVQALQRADVVNELGVQRPTNPDEDWYSAVAGGCFTAWGQHGAGRFRMPVKFGGITVECGQVPSRELLELLLQVTRDKPHLVTELRRAEEVFDVVKTFGLTSSTQEFQIPLDSAYQDLDLPRYREAYPELVNLLNQFVSNNTSNLPTGIDLSIPGHLNYISNGSDEHSKRLYNILKRVFPTYRSLGKIPPFDTWGPDDFAHGIDHFVSPDWYFARVENRGDISDSLIKSLEAAYHGYVQEHPEGVWPASKRQEIRRLLDLPENRFSSESLNGWMQKLVVTNLAGKETELVGDINVDEAAFGPANRESLKDWGSSGLAFARSTNGMSEAGNVLYQTTRFATQDNQFRVARAYPTFKVYFVRPSPFKRAGNGEVSEVIGADELFGYGAVNEIRIIRDKFYPDVAEIMLINTTSNLDTRDLFEDETLRYRSKTEIAARHARYGDSAGGERKDFLDDSVSQEIERLTGSKLVGSDSPIFLHEGVMVQIKMGYEPNPEDLPVVFNGQIAEIQYGDVIRIVCQSYASELTNIVNWYEDGDEADFFNAAIATMSQCPAVHYGTDIKIHEYKNAESAFGDALASTYALALAELWRGYQRLSNAVGGNFDAADQQAADELVDSTYNGVITNRDAWLGRNGNIIITGERSRRLENMFVKYLARDNNTFLNQIDLISFFTHRKYGKFAIPAMPGLEVLHEVARLYMPSGAICLADIPYSTRATCFIGYPSQFYFARSEADAREEIKRFNKRLRRDVSRTDSAGNIIQQAQIAKSLVIDFLRDKKFFEDYVSERGDPKKEYYDINYLRKEREQIVFNKIRPASLSSEETWPEFSSAVINDYEGMKDDLGLVNTRFLIGYLLDVFLPSNDPNRGYSVDEFNRLRTDPGSVDTVLRLRVNPLTRIPMWNEILAQLFGPQPTARHNDKIDPTNSVAKRFMTMRFGLTNLLDPDVTFERNVRGIQETATTTEAWRKQVLEFLMKDQDVVHFRNIFAAFAEWLRANGPRRLGPTRATSGAAGDRLRALRIAKTEADGSTTAIEGILTHPRLRPFRLFHYADSLGHIIRNDMFATRDEMSNVVWMRHPNTINVPHNDWDSGQIAQLSSGTEWKVWKQPADLNLLPENQKVRIVTEPNVQSHDPERRYAAYSNLADAIRPMYRGELLLRGNPQLKPYDVININDFYNDMRGPVEIERVVHHLTQESGFVSVITPHALVFPTNYSDYIEAQKHGMAVLEKALTIGAIATAAVALTVFTGGIAAGATIPAALGAAAASGLVVGGTATTIGGEIITSEYPSHELQDDFGFWDVVTGSLRTSSDRSPVKIMPLTLRGAPWTAGLIGTLGPWNRYRLTQADRDRAASKGLDLWVNSIFGISEVGDQYLVESN